jgi:hypothetical protein
MTKTSIQRPQISGFSIKHNNHIQNKNPFMRKKQQFL